MGIGSYRVLVVLVGLVIGCGGGSSDEAKPQPVAGSASETTDKPASATEPVIAAWKGIGLTTAFKPATISFGKDCQQGTVADVDAVVCSYPSEADAKQAEKPALTWVGDATGAAWTSGKYTIALVDRRKADPSGKLINRLMKLAIK